MPFSSKRSFIIGGAPALAEGLQGRSLADVKRLPGGPLKRWHEIEPQKVVGHVLIRLGVPGRGEV